MSFESRPIIPTLKNEALSLLMAAGLDWSEFTWQPFTSNYTLCTVSRIVHPRTAFYFVFDPSKDGKYKPDCWPEDVTVGASLLSQAGIVAAFKRWVSAIAPEIKAPDLWKLAAEQKTLAADPNQENL